MPIVWRDALSVGNDLIDADHQHLLTLINTLELMLTTEQPFAALRQALADLKTYTHEHFAREERIMIALRYVPYDAHKHAHGELIRQLDEATRFIGEQTDVAALTTAAVPAAVKESLIGLLRAWLVDHIVKEDLHLKPLLAGQPRGYKA
jgi:hemerythrin